ncbi:MAG: AMIN domain-containing protein, partial [Desulfobulbaceae bacterium]|nr:AMIN domain-containing protein [Desulfobulbaceae bacterium]
MLHFSWPYTKKTSFPVLCGFFLISSIFLLAAGEPRAEETATSSQKNIINSITSQPEGDTLRLNISGTATPTFTVYELFKPSRIVVDVAEAELSQSADIALPENKQISLATQAITDTTPAYLRFEFTLIESLPFTVTQLDNDIVIKIENAATMTASTKKPAGTATIVEEIKISTTPSETRVTFLANGTINDYSYDVLDRKGDTPARLYIDLNNITGDTLLKEQNVGTALDKIRVATRGSGLRIVLNSSKNELFPFQVVKIKNGLEVLIKEKEKNGDDQLST